MRTKKFNENCRGYHIPQWPWVAYGQIQTSQQISRSGNKDDIFFIAKTAGLSSLSALQASSVYTRIYVNTGYEYIGVYLLTPSPPRPH